MKAFPIFSAYCQNPEDYWAKNNPRQANKIRQRINSLQKKYNITKQDVLQEVFALALLRKRAGHPTIWIANIGSSGSHWIEDIIACSEISVAAGEVYYPVALVGKGRALSPQERAILYDAINVLHCNCLDIEVRNRYVSITSHLVEISQTCLPESSFKKVLLVRDPVDIVLSRTFRKDEYRQFIAPSQSDMEYLEKNIATVRSFFEKVDFTKFHAVLRYEEVRRDGFAVISDMLKKINISFRPDAICSAINQNTARGGQAPHEGPRKSNFFEGSMAIDSGTRSAVASRLETIRSLIQGL